MMERNVICRDCGTNMEEQTIPMTVVVSGRSYSLDAMPQYKCPNCGNMSMLQSDMEKMTKKATVLFIKDIESELPPCPECGSPARLYPKRSLSNGQLGCPRCGTKAYWVEGIRTLEEAKNAWDAYCEIRGL